MPDIEVFVSHAHQDAALIDALEGLYEECFGKRVQLVRSSDQAAGGGIPPGAQWLPWITSHISSAKRTYVLLTPSSLSKPWVLWESGAAAGVALATERERPVTPVTFGIDDDAVPSPFAATQVVKGDTDADGGILRLLQDVNEELGSPLADGAFSAATQQFLPAYLATVEECLRDSERTGTLLSTVPHAFSVDRLAGHWATAYRFMSAGRVCYHADIATVTPESERRVAASNRAPTPVTDGHPSTPFLNEVEAELVSRHLIGQWKNISDTRYFGTIHLAVQARENVMQGFYTGLEQDDKAVSDAWKWVRIDPTTVDITTLAEVRLRPAPEIHELLQQQDSRSGAIALERLVQNG